MPHRNDASHWVGKQLKAAATFLILTHRTAFYSDLLNTHGGNTGLSQTEIYSTEQFYTSDNGERKKTAPASGKSWLQFYRNAVATTLTYDAATDLCSIKSIHPKQGNCLATFGLEENANHREPYLLPSHLTPPHTAMRAILYVAVLHCRCFPRFMESTSTISFSTIHFSVCAPLHPSVSVLSL